MSNFTQIDTEYAYGKYAGADYGSKIRILMRSDTAVMFVGYGVRINLRSNDNSYSHGMTVVEKANREMLSTPEARAKIIRYFGEGADEAAIVAATTRGRGTILVNGGGDKLPLPNVEAGRIHAELYAAATPSVTGLIPVERKCRQCGADLIPSTDHHRFGNTPKEGQPKTVEECVRYTNAPIFSVTGYSASKPQEWWPYIERFTTWDGESYIDPDFCNDRCASVYGRRAAQELPSLEAGGAPPPNPYRMPDYVDHFEKAPDRFSKSGVRY